MGGWAAITTGRFDLDLGKVRDGEYGGRFYTSQQFESYLFWPIIFQKSCKNS